jgi:predicted PhzF superfamily epimerase YddE/YHI9
MNLFIVDAFTDKAFGGNPAAVCILGGAKEDRWMQGLAQEVCSSETAFLLPYQDGFSLRWFTPEVEIDLCGHATLASAHILWQESFWGRGEGIKFYTRSGVLTSQWYDDWIELNFPFLTEQAVSAPPELLDALQVQPHYVGKNNFDYLVEVESEEVVKNLKPNFDLLSRIPARGVIVTSISRSSGYDFVSRFFAPAIGIKEDPVTGSAHCCLGPYWQKRLGKDEFVAYQASARGGVIKVRVDEDRVYLSGQAVTVLKGRLEV